jgi:hypothetical protein
VTSLRLVHLMEACPLHFPFLHKCSNIK